jgi:hypothetical protein
MFQTFHLFHKYVASVLFECCKTRSGGCINMQVFHLDVCIYLQWLHTCFQVFSGVSQMFQTYVVSVSSVFGLMLQLCLSGCCKSRSGVAHVAMGPTCCTRLLQLLGHHRGSLRGCLRPADASAVRHPQTGADDWDSRVGSCMQTWWSGVIVRARW